MMLACVGAVVGSMPFAKSSTITLMTWPLAYMNRQKFSKEAMIWSYWLRVLILDPKPFAILLLCMRFAFNSASVSLRSAAPYIYGTFNTSSICLLVNKI
jgi:hypothetical protein